MLDFIQRFINSVINRFQEYKRRKRLKEGGGDVGGTTTKKKLKMLRPEKRRKSITVHHHSDGTTSTMMDLTPGKLPNQMFISAEKWGSSFLLSVLPSDDWPLKKRAKGSI